MTVQYSKTNKRFEFLDKNVSHCEDYDCYGVVNLKGYFKTGKEYGNSRI